MPKTDAIRARIGPEERAALDAILTWLGERQPDPTDSDGIRIALRRFAASIQADSVQTLKNNPKEGAKKD